MCHRKNCPEYVYLRLKQFTNSHTKDTSDSCYSLRKTGDYWRECPISEEKKMKHAASRERNEKILEVASEHTVQELAQMFDVSEYVIRSISDKKQEVQ